MIPLYGSLSGMHFDPHTKLFHGDGPPRSTPYRLDGSWPVLTRNTQGANLGSTSTDPEDVLHLQPKDEVRDKLRGFGEEHGIVRWRLCRCVNAWNPEATMKDHVCQASTVERRVPATPATFTTMRFQSQERNEAADDKSVSGSPDIAEDQKVTKSKNYASLATGNGDGDQSGVKIRDFAEFIADSEKKTFSGTIVRDFARPKGMDTIAVRF